MLGDVEVVRREGLGVEGGHEVEVDTAQPLLQVPSGRGQRHRPGGPVRSQRVPGLVDRHPGPGAGGGPVGGGGVIGQVPVGRHGAVGRVDRLAVQPVGVGREDRHGGEGGQQPGQGGDGYQGGDRPAVGAHVGAEGAGEHRVDGAGRARDQCVPGPDDHQCQDRHDRWDQPRVGGDEEAEGLAAEGRGAHHEQRAHTAAHGAVAAGVGGHGPHEAQGPVGRAQEQRGADQAHRDRCHPPDGVAQAAGVGRQRYEAASQVLGAGEASSPGQGWVSRHAARVRCRTGSGMGGVEASVFSRFSRNTTRCWTT